MAGYDNYSMSNNARRAYEDGLVSLSKINSSWLRDNEIPLSVSHARWLAENHVGADEWHHTSKTYNKTNFYSAESLRSFINEHGTKEDEFRQFKQPKPVEQRPAVASWTEWVRVPGRMAKKKQITDVQGHVIGDWFHHEGGKKSIHGGHIEIRYV